MNPNGDMRRGRARAIQARGWVLRTRRLVVLLLGLLLAGCEPSHNAEQAPVTELDFWVMGQEGEAVTGLIEAFEQQYPDIRIRKQQIPWSAAHEKLLTAYVGEVMPDVFQLGNTWVPELVELGALAPLDAFYRQSNHVSLADYFPGVLAANQLQAQTFAAPWYVDTRVLFYRRDLLLQAGVESAPRSWQEWRDGLRKLREQLGDKRFAILLPLREWASLVSLAMQNGAELVREQATRGDFQSAAFREAFAFYVDLYREQLAPATSANQVANLYQGFGRGDFVSFISGPWNLGELRRRLPPEQQSSWDTAPLPGPAEQYPGVSIAGGASLAIAASSKHPQAAWRWIEFLSQASQQARFYALSGDLPAVRAAWDYPELQEESRVQAFAKQLSAVQAPPKIPEWERIATLISAQLEAVVLGGRSIDEALAQLDEQVDRLLEKRRWILAQRAEQATATGEGAAR